MIGYLRPLSLANTENPIAEVIAVPCLIPDPKAASLDRFISRTWETETEQLQLDSFLDRCLQTANESSSGIKVWLFDYSGHETDGPSVGNAADDLLDSVRRLYAQNPTRPIIFISHSLGAFIVKQALNDARDQDSTRRLDCPLGTVFFAAPHRSWGVGGVEEMSMKAIRQLAAGLVGREERRVYRKRLERGGFFKSLEEICEDFARNVQATGILVESFAEGKPVGEERRGEYEYVIERENATLGLSRIDEKATMLERNHLDICNMTYPLDTLDGRSFAFAFREMVTMLDRGGRKMNDPPRSRRSSASNPSWSPHFVHNMATSPNRGPRPEYSTPAYNNQFLPIAHPQPPALYREDCGTHPGRWAQGCMEGQHPPVGFSDAGPSQHLAPPAAAQSQDSENEGDEKSPAKWTSSCVKGAAEATTATLESFSAGLGLFMGLKDLKRSNSEKRSSRMKNNDTTPLPRSHDHERPVSSRPMLSATPKLSPHRTQKPTERRPGHDSLYHDSGPDRNRQSGPFAPFGQGIAQHPGSYPTQQHLGSLTQQPAQRSPQHQPPNYHPPLAPSSPRGRPLTRRDANPNPNPSTANTAQPRSVSINEHRTGLLPSSRPLTGPPKLQRQRSNSIGPMVPSFGQGPRVVLERNQTGAPPSFTRTGTGIWPRLNNRPLTLNSRPTGFGSRPIANRSPQGTQPWRGFGLGFTSSTSASGRGRGGSFR